MRLIAIAEATSKDFFDYSDVAEDMWRTLVSAEQDETKINFDLENNYDIAKREITIDQDRWDFTKCKFKCELYEAGGDWETPVLYFRCERSDGYARRRDKDLYNHNKHFVFIPGPDEGNPHLVKSKNGYTAPDSDVKVRPGEKEQRQRTAWNALKKLLQTMVDDAVASSRKYGD